MPLSFDDALYASGYGALAPGLLRPGSLTFAPEWVPDTATVRCMACAASFGVQHRRHHCRACGRLVCGGCSGGRLRLEHLGCKEPNQRACDACVAQRMGPGTATGAATGAVSRGGGSLGGAAAGAKDLAGSVHFSNAFVCPRCFDTFPGKREVLAHYGSSLCLSAGTDSSDDFSVPRLPPTAEGGIKGVAVGNDGEDDDEEPPAVSMRAPGMQERDALEFEASEKEEEGGAAVDAGADGPTVFAPAEASAAVAVDSSARAEELGGPPPVPPRPGLRPGLVPAPKAAAFHVPKEEEEEEEEEEKEEVGDRLSLVSLHMGTDMGTDMGMDDGPDAAPAATPAATPVRSPQLLPSVGVNVSGTSEGISEGTSEGTGEGTREGTSEGTREGGCGSSKVGHDGNTGAEAGGARGDTRGGERWDAAGGTTPTAAPEADGAPPGEDAALAELSKLKVMEGSLSPAEAGHVNELMVLLKGAATGCVRLPTTPSLASAAANADNTSTASALPLVLAQIAAPAAAPALTPLVPPALPLRGLSSPTPRAANAASATNTASTASTSFDADGAPPVPPRTRGLSLPAPTGPTEPGDAPPAVQPQAEGLSGSSPLPPRPAPTPPTQPQPSVPQLQPPSAQPRPPELFAEDFDF